MKLCRTRTGLWWSGFVLESLVVQVSPVNRGYGTKRTRTPNAAKGIEDSSRADRLAIMVDRLARGSA